MVTSSKVSSPADAAPTSADRSSFEADRRVQVPLAADQRVQLADPAGLALADEHLRRPAGMQEAARLAGSKASATPSRAASPSSTPLSAKKSAGSPPPRHEPRRQRPDRQAAEPVRLGERRRPLAGETPPAERADVARAAFSPSAAW